MRCLLGAIALAACSAPFTPAESTPDASLDAPVVDDAADATADHDVHDGDGARCETVGRTGAGSGCRLFAYCGHRHFDLDCTARFTCVCSEPDIDGGPTKQIVAQPAFCEGPETELASAFEAARRACHW